MLVSEHSAADDEPHDFVGALKNLVHPHIAQYALDGIVAQIAITAMQLQAAIDRFKPCICCKPLCLRRKPGAARLARIYRDRRTMQQQARGLNFGRVIGDTKLQRLKIGEPGSELPERFHVIDGAIETELRASNRAGTDVQPAAVESAHRDLETLPFRADAVRDLPARVLENHHAGRLCFPAELFFLRAERQARCPLFDNDAGYPSWTALACARHNNV